MRKQAESRASAATASKNAARPPPAIKNHNPARVYASSCLLFLILVFAFYMLITVARPGVFHEHQNTIAFLFGLVTLVTLLRLMEDWSTQVAPSRQGTKWHSKLWALIVVFLKGLFRLFYSETSFSKFIRWALVGTAIFLTWYVFRGFWPVVGEMVEEGGWLYLGLLMFLAINALWTDMNVERFGKIIVVSMLNISFVFAYVAILVFAYRIYPYIPVERGGGDYTGEVPSVLTFDARFASSIPRQVISTNFQSKPLIVVHENPNHVFIYLPKATDKTNLVTELSRWRLSGVANRPAVIYAIRQEAVIAKARAISWPVDGGQSPAAAPGQLPGPATPGTAP
jgi:hypothetical protein